MNKYEKTKEDIIQKFDSVKRFSMLIGMNYHTMIKKFMSQDDDQYLQMIQGKIEETENHSIEGVDLTMELKDRLKMALLNHDDAHENGKRSISNFCKKNPEFSNTHLSLIFTTREFGIKSITSKVRELAKKINFNLYEH